MDNLHVPTPSEENCEENHDSGLPAAPEETSPDSGLGYCQKSILLLSALAVACIILVLSPAAMPDALPFIMAFPFAQIGRGLRALSLPGGVGNIIAIVLYVVFCLVPMIPLPLIRNKKAEDVLLPVISIVLFVVMYFMINPGITRVAAIAGPMEQVLYSSIVYSLLIAYGVIRVLRLFDSATPHRLGRYMGVMLHLLNIIFIFAAFGLTFAQMLAAFEALRAGNTIPGQQLSATYVFLALQHIVRALPYVLNVWVVLAVQRLLAALTADPYSKETLLAAKLVSRVCVVVLTVSVLAAAGFNLSQLIFVDLLHVVNSNLNFPVTSVLFVLGALLLTRYIAENKQIKDENDMFV